MLGTKRRLWILLMIGFMGLISLAGVITARLFDLNINIQNPYYFGTNYQSRFSYDNGTSIVTLEFDSIVVDETYSICNITIDSSSIFTYNVSPEGYYIDPIDGETRNFSIFWVGLVGIINGTGSETVEQAGHTYGIIDIIGILGAPNTPYNLTVTTVYNYWPEEPGLFGAHKSVLYEVRDSNNVKVAIGEIDYTSGMLFYAHIGAGNIRYLKLEDTDFPIARNRLTGIPIVTVVAIATPIVVFFYLYFKKKEPREKLIDTMFLICVGEVVIIVDIFIDVWMYAFIPGGMIGNMVLHAALASVLAVYALYRKVGLKWVIPAFVELLFIYAMCSYTGDSYVPHLTAFMGLSISYLCLLWITGYERIPSKSRLGKIISEFI